ncbi:hypothetical protein E3J79_00860 [Candidatus Dependentiae bacterium]|nr:MAG: hypothetical protein E3J79_00860 [Candidatus Dependentiae bacterium]
MGLILAILFLLCVPTCSFTKPRSKIFTNVRVVNLFANNLEAKKIFASDNVDIAGDLDASNGNFSGDLSVGGSINGQALVNSDGSSTVNAVARFANTSGTRIKNSLVLVDDIGNIQIDGITKNGITISWPSTTGPAGHFLESDGVGNLVYGTPAGAGNVSTVAPFGTNNALLTTDLPNGTENVKDTTVYVDGSNNITGVNALTANTVNAPTLNGNATTATDFTGSLAGDVSGTQAATVVDEVGGQTSVNVASATIAANAATDTNTPNTIVKRNGSGNFIAGTITANLTGNVTGNLSGNATTATNATNATNFTGPLTGDVTGNQSTTQVIAVGGQSAANVASATVAANAATSSNTASTIVKRDGSGNFSAGTITANLSGNVTGNLTGNADTATSAVTAGTATNFSGALTGDVSGTQGATVVDTVGGQTAANVASATIAANAATDTNTPNTIVKRNGSGNFITNKINITGSIINATDAATKDYVDNAASTGIIPKEPALVVGLNNIILSGTQTIDGVALSVDDRVLLVGQTGPIENGLWLTQVSTWTRPNDFASGNTAGQAYVLTTSGATKAGTGWLCSTPTAVIDTDSIEFVQFTAPGQTTGANVGTGVGQIFRDKTGVTLNFKTLAENTHMVITNNADDVTIGTDATSVNTPSTIVARDGTGTFAGSLTGAASQNVLKAGDTMIGNLNMATQSQVRYQDAAGGEYVGLRAPAAVGSSYTVDLPANPPVAGQYLKALSSFATTWTVVYAPPALTKTYYVTLIGDDSNDGSLSAPFRTIKHAVNQANAVASSNNRVVIDVGAGTFIEDNSGGPITITADGISIKGSAQVGTMVIPSTASINLFDITVVLVELTNLTLQANPGPSSTASAINVTTESFGSPLFKELDIFFFQTGISASSLSGNPVIVLKNSILVDNETCISYTNMRSIIQSNIFGGQSINVPANRGIYTTGAGTDIAILDCFFTAYDNAIDISGGSHMRVLNSNIEITVNGIVCSGGSKCQIVGANFKENTATSVNLTVTGVGTKAYIEGCLFDCEDAADVSRGTAIKVTTGASLIASDITIEKAVLGIECGAAGDTNTTVLQASSVNLIECTTNIKQVGSSIMHFVGGTFEADKLDFEDATNIHISAFNSSDHAYLAIGDSTDASHILYQVLNGKPLPPGLCYEADYYGNKGTVYKNPNGDPTFNGTQAASNNARYYVITGDRTKEASVNLISDTGNVGVDDNIRGWTIAKRGTQADLAFTYTNNDTSGLAARGANSVMQLNGFDNQVEFPTATNAPLPTNTTAKLVWAGDTNLYRDSANTLKTDDDLIIDGLTANRAVATDVNKKLSSSATTDTELGYLSGVTSSIQTQIDGKVAKVGDTMTGTLILPAGTAASPSVKFTGSTNTGISAGTPNVLSFDTSGNERMSVSDTTITAAVKLVLNTLLCNQGVEVVTANTGGSVTVLSSTSILLLKYTGNVNNYTITFPPSPTNGQLFTIVTANTTQWINIINTGGVGGAAIVNPITQLEADAAPTATQNGASVTYWYYSPDNTWYRSGRG